jgi:polyisoprenoid-binding protein YceI
LRLQSPDGQRSPAARRSRSRGTIMATDIATPATAVPTGTWAVDPAHSKVGFAVKHMGIATVRGEFTEFEGTLEIGEDLASAKAYGTVAVATVDTNEPQRDDHLRSPDFFDAESFPEIRFESKSIEHLEGSKFRVVGELTIRGTAREVELEAEFTGANKDPWGNDRIGLAVRGELDPNDYGVDWNQELETGGNVLGDRVNFTANISAVKAA